ncbi:MAG: phosphoribosylaminoimidazolesuccinocarboxamide synthase [Deltaproteobacteria bacterium]|nr:phosphoribosylaminoimidazolesuccinocarboxamide synthase [Deltaproteobacteria bacterium]
MEKGAKLYEGKAKILYETEDPDYLIQYFKDDATAFNNQKRGTIVNKGVVNNKISEALFRRVEAAGVKTHFVKRLNDREMLVKRLEILPLEVIVRNRVAGTMARRYGLEEGTLLKQPVIEFSYKNDDLGDPLITVEHVLALGWAAREEIDLLIGYTEKVNATLSGFFDEKGFILVDFKIEFGRHHGEILLGDEICQDTMRLWEKETLKKMDKDRFRRDLGGVEEAYNEICGIVCEGGE